MPSPKPAGAILLAVLSAAICVGVLVYLFALLPIQELDGRGRALVGKTEQEVRLELGEPWRAYDVANASTLHPGDYLLPPPWPPEHKTLLYRQLNFVLFLDLDESGVVQSAYTVKKIGGYW